MKKISIKKKILLEDSNSEKISQENLHENDNLDLAISVFNSSSEKSEINNDWQDNTSHLSQEDVQMG